MFDLSEVELVSWVVDMVTAVLAAMGWLEGVGVQGREFGMGLSA